MYRFDNRINSKTRKDNSAADAENTLLERMAFLRMINDSPVAVAYLQDCDMKNRDLKKISEGVEMGLCACAWLTG